MRSSIPNIMRAVHAALWSILPEKMDAMLEFLELRASGVAFTDEELAARGVVSASARPQPRVAGKVAVLPLYGVIGQHMGMEMQISGGTSTEAFGRAFDDAMSNPDVGAIVIDANSPGGTTYGVPELASKIFNARGKGKRIIAIANSEMNSAACWVGFAADEVYATPSAFVGSIGVFTMHTDTSGAEEKAGIKRTVISAGRYKGEAAPGVPLTDEALAAKQAMVSECYAMFAGDVARFRGTTIAAVKAGYGEGRSISAKQALAAGMIDRIATLDEVLAELSGRTASSGTARRFAASGSAALAAGPLRVDVSLDAAELSALLATRTQGQPLLLVDTSDPALCPECGATLVDGECPDREQHETESIPTDDEGPEARGGAREGKTVTPATTPAPKARSSTMSDKDTAAERAALIKAETTRQNEIRALCAENDIETDAMNGFLSSEMTMEAVSAEILKRKRAERAKAPTVRSPGGGLVTGVRNRIEDDPARGFRNPRDWAMAVMKHSDDTDPSAVADERLRSIAVLESGGLAFMLPHAFTPKSMLLATQGSDEQSTTSFPYGGSTVSSARSPMLLQLGAEGDPSMGRTTEVPMEAPLVEFDARVDKNHTTSVSGGFVWTRKAEAATGSTSRGQFEKVKLEANTLFGAAFATYEILQRSRLSFAAVIESGFREQLGPHMLNEKLRGGGAGEYLGILTALAASNLGPTISIAKESGQVADTIVTANLLKMRSRCWGYGQAIWMANHDTYPQLATLSIGVGAAGALAYQQSVVEDRPDMLLGRPIFYTEYANTLGDQGDIILANWSQYLEGMYSPVQSEESIHARFFANEKAFKFFLSNAGLPWWKTALTPNKSAQTLSPFVVLDAR